jgi:branched-chain amino acid transport system permease protein
MYIAYWLFTLVGIDPYLGFFVAMGVMFAGGWYMQKYIVNRMMDAPHYNQFLLFLGISIFLESFALFLWPDYRQLQVSYQNVSIYLAPGHGIELVRLIAFLIAVALNIGLYYFLKKSNLGKAIRATSQSKAGAQAVGINIRKINALTFAIGSACAAGAGAVICPYYPTFYGIGNLFLMVPFVVVCLGGMGNLVGAMIGGLLIGLAESLGSVIISGGQKEIVIYAIFILFMLFRPQGLFRFGGYWQTR